MIFAALGGVEDAVEGFVSGCVIGVSHAHFGIVDDGGEDVVEFVCDGGGECPHGAQPLCSQEFFFKNTDSLRQFPNLLIRIRHLEPPTASLPAF